ncbi:XylR family transcriptional regulator [Pseudoduganella namucuonensis]|uniref:Transcriptional regulator, AraC family n=1 Tax=Pseudoduganella namucuonensis TaxID=1035707 RepID=A0A1I7J9G1_9BURK|nr:DNA-binding transcriptional regulator [Pseudoduganella namucuonensis]SFU81836.1 transcriptional regulator, AraC family [Pseudoduganella namucuonensis]
MKTTKVHRIALLFNANKIFDHEVIAGIAAYFGSTRTAWDIFVEEDFRLRLPGIEHWQGDAIIANFDDPSVAAALSRCRVPVVAVGGSYADPANYPAGVPYVATDNFKLIELARQHLIDVGLQRLAMFSVPATEENRWARERENAFRNLTRGDQLEPEIFRGCETSVHSWDEAVQGQVDWLRSLPKPVGIIAVSDARARQLLQACIVAGIEVPEQVAIIGIDNDPLVRRLTRIPLSSVIQGAQEMGRAAAHLIEKMLHGVRLPNTRIVVPPAGINVFASSQYQLVKHPNVMRARHFIRQYACQGIKTEQVAQHVGVSRSSLDADFRQELGCSVRDVILSFKLNAAKAALESGDCSIADVALGSGLTSIQHMHRVFKRELGCTPRAYRDRVLSERGQMSPA